MESLGGPDLLLYLVLAFGGAMFVGNLMALVRPPSKRPPGKGSGRTAPKGPGKVTNGQRPATGPRGQDPVGPSPDDGSGQQPSGKAATKPGPKTSPKAASMVPPKSAPLPAAPRARTIAMMSIGGVATLWSLATLLTK